MKHIAWLDPDQIIISNSSNDFSYKKIMEDVRENVILIRLLETKFNSINFSSTSADKFIRYLVKDDICWFFLDKCIIRDDIYYSSLIYISLDETINKLNKLYTTFDREFKLEQLGI